MNDTHTTQTVRPPMRTLAAGAGDPAPAAGVPDALRSAQATLRRSQDLRGEMERLLGGIELDDLRNGGGQ